MITEKTAAKKRGKDPVPQSATKENIRFTQNLSRKFLKRNRILGIDEIAHVLIIATAPPENPMTEAGIELWSWGALTINDIPIPAPFLRKEIIEKSLLAGLTEEYIAVTSTYFWLDSLISLWRMPKEKIRTLAGSDLDLGLEWIDRVSEEKIQEILTALHLKASENPNARQTLEWAFGGSQIW